MEAQPISSQEDAVLDAKPLRSLAPMFPAPYGFNTSFTSFGSAPAVCVNPFGGSSSSGGGFPPFFFNPEPASRQKADDASVQRASNRTPAANGSYHSGRINLEDDPDYTVHTSTSGRKIKRPKNLKRYKVDDSDSEGADGSGKKKSQIRRKTRRAPELALIPSSLLDARNSAEEILMTFDALRRKILQLDEANDASKRSYLKAGAIMMSNDLRANIVKRIGPVPGVEIGDIFYFRIEMCLVGLHAQIMGGIDYMLPRHSDVEEPLAISIVSAGGYENDEGDTNVLIYTGQGGGCSSKYDKNQVVDQKLERGNLALERSLHRGNLVRVIRSAKDMNLINGRIYIFDGLYKIQETWVEKAKAGNNVFKYKLFREPGQPEGIAVWKHTEKWKANPSSRGGVLPDISSGVENLPVFLVNEVDNEKGPSHFTYATKVKYLKPIIAMRPLPGCRCISVCLPGDASCSCAQQNGGNLPYCANGFVVSRKHVLYECNSLCSCSVNCRNRVTQKGVSLHFEVFRTRDRGWGLRSWDPIRAGTFICEYVGEVVDKIKVNDYGEEDQYIFHGNYIDEKTLKWNHGPELLGEPSINESDIFKPLPIIISSRNVGNVARFMNHSCSPNVLWQPVLHDHDEGDYPHIMFFAMKHIPPMMELTFDYGLSSGNAGWNVAGTRQPKKCLCGSPKCRGLFR